MREDFLKLLQCQKDGGSDEQRDSQPHDDPSKQPAMTAPHTAAPTTKVAATTTNQARPDEAVKVQPVASYADGADGDEQNSRNEPSYHQLVAIDQQQPAEDISRSAAQQNVISGSALKSFQQSSEADEKIRQHCLAI